MHEKQNIHKDFKSPNMFFYLYYSAWINIEQNFKKNKALEITNNICCWLIWNNPSFLSHLGLVPVHM